MSDQPSAEAAKTNAEGDLLRGGKPIARVAYNDDSPKAVRRLYAEMARLPVFQLTPRGPLFAFRSRLLKHFEALSLAKEQQIVEAAMRTAAALPTAQPKTPKPARAQKRARLRKVSRVAAE
jgi:hypothetical protein